MDTGDMVVAHMIADYAFQNDWMAKNKTKVGKVGLKACAIHAGIYTGTMLAMSLLTGKRLGWKALLLIGGTHFLIDRYRLAHRSMEFTGQKDFRDNQELFGVWPGIVVDNTWHLAINTLAIKAFNK